MSGGKKINASDMTKMDWEDFGAWVAHQESKSNVSQEVIEDFIKNHKHDFLAWLLKGAEEVRRNNGEIVIPESVQKFYDERKQARENAKSE